MCNIMLTSYKKFIHGIHMNTFICIASKSHYEALNISKTATHKEIKDAYYRLSMIYHPDKNKGSEDAAKMFRDITTAYEVLGNVRQRRLYDSGAVGVKSAQTNSKYGTAQQYTTMNTKSDLYKTTAQSKNYNFDEWSKAHYSNVFQRQYEAREKVSRNKVNQEIANQQNTYIVLTIMLTISLIIIVFMFENVKKVVREKSDLRFSKKKD